MRERAEIHQIVDAADAGEGERETAEIESRRAGERVGIRVRVESGERNGVGEG